VYYHDETAEYGKREGREEGEHRGRGGGGANPGDPAP
jgi:hypothetical protein